MRARQYVPKGGSTLLMKPLRQIPGGRSEMELLAVGESCGLPEPKWPFDGDPKQYADELRDTHEAMDQSKRGEWPAWFFNKYAAECKVPIDWNFEDIPSMLAPMVQKTDPMTLPQLVTMDVPYQLTAECWHWSVEKAGGFGAIRLQNPTVPGHIEFHEIASGYFYQCSKSIYIALGKAARAKNFFAVMRPEAVVNELLSPHVLPRNHLTSAPNGCPPHDSYPAGHGAFDGAQAKAHEDFFIETPSDRMELRAGCFLHAMGRSTLGVHTPQDNIKGFELGWGVYDDEPSITAEQFYAARGESEDGEVDFLALVEKVRSAESA